MSVTKTMTRLGMVVFLFIFNIGISAFVFLLTGMMIFSQVLFIIYAMFLPISFVLSMIPTYEGMAKKALTKLFNTVMMRAGITLIITTAFSISTMFYSISSGYPFFMVAFLQIVTFAGIYFKLGDLMTMFSLQSSDTQQVSRRIMRHPYMFLNRRARRLERKIGRTMAAGAAGGVAGAAAASASTKRQTIPNRQVIRIPEQITILLLLPVEVTASRQLCRIPNHRSRLHCRIRKVRRIPHRPYIVHKAIHRNHSLPQSVELWIKIGIETAAVRQKESAASDCG